MSALRRAIVCILLEDLDPFGPAMTFLKKVDASDYHMVPMDSLTDNEVLSAERLVSQRLLRPMPADARFPDRYVVTSGGSHALQTFVGDTYHDEKKRRRRTGSYFAEADAPRIDLAAERHRLMTTWSRDDLIDWLVWNDPNGIWTDEDMVANDMDPMSQEEAIDQVMSFVQDNMETPEEMMGASLRANPGRYPKPEEFDRF